MLEEEALWIAEKLTEFEADAVSPVIMLGSRLDLYGPGGQSFIYKHIISPCEQRGIRFIHSDLEDGEGVDIAGDIYDEETLAKLKQANARTVICANILEHVLDPNKLANRCIDVIETDGFAVFTVPHSFPYHPAPIDTQYRPNCDQIIEMLSDVEVISAEQVDCGSFLDQVIRSPFRFVKHVGQMLLFVPNYRRSLSAFHRNMWLFRNYKVSCVFVRKISKVF